MPQDQQEQASEATATNQKKAGSGKPSAAPAALLGQDTRPTFKLNGINGKPVKVPSIEESLYLIYCELYLMRLQQKTQGGR